MTTEIFRDFGFEAAHRLPNVAPDHKCARLHGHSFRVRVHVAGAVEEETGWVMDFAELSAACEPIRVQLDHHHLNELAGLENPTSEVIAAWIWQRLAPTLPGLTRIVVQETCTSGVEYRGPMTPRDG